ncbi:hypothetical protein N2152v2_010173 [Parachlorella kessleri]
MVRISVDLLRRRAEHNEGVLATLQEITLHQQNIERIELINQLCRHLRILYLQNNVICKIERLNRLKELEHLNLAVNCITKVQNLQRCESLRRLDLTINFVEKAGLLSLASLKDNEFLEDLILVGNPCTTWPGYRPYVVALLPQLNRLDGEEIVPSERIAAQQQLAALDLQLREELAAEGIDLDTAARVEDDSLLGTEEIEETGYLDEQGELRRPWCRETRILEHREQERELQQAEERRRTEQQKLFEGSGLDPQPPKLRHDFPLLTDGEAVYQKNEGKWDFTLDESPDGCSVVLDVDVGRYLDTSLIQADVQPTFVRLLIKGRLLQLLLPQEVRPDSSTAQRSKTTGHLVITMPKEDPQDGATFDVTHTRPAVLSAGAAPSEEQQAAGVTASIAASLGPRVALTGLPAGRPLALRNSSSCGLARGPARKGSVVWEHDSEGNMVEKPLQKAALVEAQAATGPAGGTAEGAAGGEEDDLPPL